jgi:hypothetical protein
MADYKVLNFEDAQAFAYRFIQQRPLSEFLRKLRSLVDPIILPSSDHLYADILPEKSVKMAYSLSTTKLIHP